MNDQDQRLHDFAKRANGRKPSRGINPSVRLPSWERLLEIDAAAEAETARQRQAIAGPRMRQGELFAVETTIET